MNFEEIAMVLVVDDDPILSTVAEAYFMSRGVRKVLTAANGGAALNLLDAKADEIDFVLCDLNMPEMDGAQFFRHLAELEFTKPVVILSGEDRAVVALAANLAQSHNLNFAGALQKPLNTAALDKLIGEAVASPAESEPENLHPQLEGDDLQAAISSGQITTFYQPKIHVGTGALAGAEALARWEHPEFGLIMPDAFIPLAEQSGLMAELSENIFAQAIKDTRQLRKLTRNWHTAMNVDPSLLLDVEFPNKIKQAVLEAELSPSDFTLEITEVNPIERNAVAMEVLLRLRMIGFGLSIDDFGKDYSNIAYLKEFPFSEIKIDRSFVKGLPDDDRARATVRAIVSLSRDIGLQVIAEGVETAEQWRYVAAEGIDQIQGYFVARPMPLADLDNWRLEYRRSNTDLSKVLSETRTTILSAAAN